MIKFETKIQKDKSFKLKDHKKLDLKHHTTKAAFGGIYQTFNPQKTSLPGEKPRKRSAGALSKEKVELKNQDL
jgi:hypothetical protein